MKFLFPALLLCASLAFAQFDDDDDDGDEWADFDYKHAGLSQSEFQSVKSSGMGKDKLLHLLEIGVRPSEYLREPWKRLGVSEEKWLSQRESGMEDSDIDRTYKNRSGDQGTAYLSFLLPSFYQWSMDEVAKAVAMDIAYVSAWAFTGFLMKDGGKQWVQIGVPLVVGIHLWSGIDALLATQWDSNPDARDFSWGIFPTGKNAFVAGASFKF